MHIALNLGGEGLATGATNVKGLGDIVAAYETKQLRGQEAKRLRGEDAKRLRD